MVQHGRIDEGSQLRLAANDVFRLASDPIPDRIERGQFGALRIDLMHCHWDFSGVSLGPCLERAYSTAGGRLSRGGLDRVNPSRTPSPEALYPVGRGFPEIKR